MLLYKKLKLVAENNMKTIAVVGMGIIGGSICGALTKAGYTVDGFGRSESSLDYGSVSPTQKLLAASAWKPFK